MRLCNYDIPLSEKVLSYLVENWYAWYIDYMDNCSGKNHKRKYDNFDSIILQDILDNLLQD